MFPAISFPDTNPSRKKINAPIRIIMSSSSLPTRARFSPRYGLGFMAAIALTSASLHAAPLYWAPNGQTPGPGGNGTWNLTDLYWAPNANGSGTLQAWPNTTSPTDDAVFGGTAGNVTVNGTVYATAVSFTTGGYALTGGQIYLKPTANLSGLTMINLTSGTGNTTVSSNLTFDVTNRAGSQTRYIVRNQTTGHLTLSGNIFVDSSVANVGTKFISFNQDNANGELTFSGNITGGANISTALQFGSEGTSSSSAKYYITGNNTGLLNGNVADITKGIVYAGSSNALGTGTIRFGNGSAAADSAQLLTNAAITLANNISATGDGAATRTVGGGSAHQSTFSGNVNLYNSPTSYNLKITASVNGRTDFSGVISDGNGTASIEKNGAGIVRLTNAAGNTYDGGTTVSAGTLIVTNTSNSATGTGGVQIAANAALGGTGSISGLVTASAANSIVSPGDMAITGVSSIGTLNLLGGLTAASGANFKFDLNGASSDLINFGTAAVTLSGTVTFDFANLGVVQEGTTYTLFTGTGGTWNNAGSTFVFNGPSGYQLDTTYGTNGYLWDASGHSLSVRFDAIPEPATSLLIGLGLSVVLFARRKHTRLS